MPRAGSTGAIAALRDRLYARRAELGQAAQARIEAIGDPGAAPDPAYVEGLRAALGAALDYGMAAMAAPDRDPGPVPIELHAQARVAARNGVSLDAVLRRCAAGHSLLTDAVLDEAGAVGVEAGDLQPTLRALAVFYDRVVATVGDEYAREAAAHTHGSEQRRVRLLRRLLAGEPLDASELAYDFDGHHLAAVATGSRAAEGLAALGARLDRRVLLARPDDQVAWAWFGGRRRFARDELEAIASWRLPGGVAIACGTPSPGPAGWRLSHHQASAALPFAQRGPIPFVHYTDVTLIAAALRDDLLSASLRQAYLAPLEAERDSGVAAKGTLRAYFAAGGNVSSAASALGVSRSTVSSRVAAIEERLGRPIVAIAAELETALRLDEFEAGRQPPLRN